MPLVSAVNGWSGLPTTWGCERSIQDLFHSSVGTWLCSDSEVLISAFYCARCRLQACIPLSTTKTIWGTKITGSAPTNISDDWCGKQVSSHSFSELLGWGRTMKSTQNLPTTTFFTVEEKSTWNYDHWTPMGSVTTLSMLLVLNIWRFKLNQCPSCCCRYDIKLEQSPFC
jgi:hypothetical protein